MAQEIEDVSYLVLDRKKYAAPCSRLVRDNDDFHQSVSCVGVFMSVLHVPKCVEVRGQSLVLLFRCHLPYL